MVNPVLGLLPVLDLAIFVSRRLQRALCALLCLAMAQLVLAACEPQAPAARLAL
jgi:hypothetical protein